MKLASWNVNSLRACGRKGYAGTAIFSREETLTAQYGLGNENEESEGEII